MNTVAPFSVEVYQPRASITLAAWLKKTLPPRDYLLGDLLCTTSRWILYGETGVGKTLFAMALAGAVASGSPLLTWDGRRGARVMYIDGELPSETYKERMHLVAEQYGPGLDFYGYNRDDLGDDAMPPLNTEAGEKWLLKEIDAVKPDLVVFDSIMCLLTGSMAEEESWAPVKVLMRRISGRRIAQIWLHHTGHDTSKGFGTKTREWEVDTVISLTRAESEGEDLLLEFKKARLRKPETRAQFEPRTIRYEDGDWVAGEGRGKSSEGKEKLKRAILAAYDHLAASVPRSPGFDAALVNKVRTDALRDQVRSRGYLDVDEKGCILATSRTAFHRAKIDILGTKTFVESEGQFWRIAKP